MAIAISQTLEALCAVVQSLPIGTNLALLHFLWMQLSGTLLLSRGALFPALQAIGLFPAAVRRFPFRGLGDRRVTVSLGKLREGTAAMAGASI